MPFRQESRPTSRRAVSGRAGECSAGAGKASAVHHGRRPGVVRSSAGSVHPLFSDPSTSSLHNLADVVGSPVYHFPA